ncbi:hypothetical protein N7468_005470 [Penicillium chermesinum]|uniref:S-adenosyl-L-methionine-dependent methyltransferase n=1 Tax=Penicillium chermesinum TaxID=63820 RepID=A0A9W9NZB2_9EURO|nr:uncharacterized protein N7468_005470 [Penicillium chermesinum]KAJ5232514.1 hypothetical protein N7468_005470 [Penicillium chermesinum]KAJ6172168.1 hypothetical protein N7470_001235 [Penicillium chermesinum]
MTYGATFVCLLSGKDAMRVLTIDLRGREYQKFSIDHRIYFGPVDDEEAQRLDAQHRIFQALFDDRLIFPPVRQLRRVLDCGHGAASWAVEVADQNPRCEFIKVIGVDIAPHMSPDDMPENLWLQVGGKHSIRKMCRRQAGSRIVDDLNRAFTFPSNHFDLVHSRLLATGIHHTRWPSYVRDIVRCESPKVLTPGGWVQMVEIYFNVQSDNGSITDSHALRRWSAQYMRALEDRKDLRIGSRLRGLFVEAGLEEVDMKMIPLPLSEWSSDANMRSIGQSNSRNVNELLRSLALYPMTQRLHMSKQNFDSLVEEAQQEANDISLKAYFPIDSQREGIIDMFALDENRHRNRV